MKLDDWLKRNYQRGRFRQPNGAMSHIMTSRQEVCDSRLAQYQFFQLLYLFERESFRRRFRSIEFRQPNRGPRLGANMGGTIRCHGPRRACRRNSAAHLGEANALLP
jgi:hypothetical protein